ncbi:hypothetical protein WJ30_10780 [Burkholderia diffusa]|nr:hypothetical protein WJ30_10780 [Burkholderia diffusa]
MCGSGMSFIERLHVSTNQIGVVPIAYLFQQIVDAALFRLPLDLTRSSLFSYLANCLVALSFSPETFQRLTMAGLDRGHDVRKPVENVGILMVFEPHGLVRVLVDDEFEETRPKDAMTEKSIPVFVIELLRVSTEASFDETYPDRGLVADKVNVMTAISHPRREPSRRGCNTNTVEYLQRSFALQLATPDHFMIVGSTLGIARSRREILLP